MFVKIQDTIYNANEIACIKLVNDKIYLWIKENKSNHIYHQYDDNAKALTEFNNISWRLIENE